MAVVSEERNKMREVDREILDDLLEKKDLQALKKKIDQYNSVDIYKYIETLDTFHSVMVFRILRKDDAAEVFSKFNTEQQVNLLKAFTDDEIKDIMDDIYFDDMVDMIEELPSGVVKKVLRFSDDEHRKLINEFLNYPEDSAGSLMTIEFVELKRYMTVKEALDYIRINGLDKVTVYTCYITGPERKLLGFVSLRDIVTATDDTILDDLMDEDVIYVHTHDDQEYVASVFRKYGFVALPVVDNEGRLTGIITVDDILEVMEDEATEDFQRMAAIAPDEQTYLEQTPWKLAKHRVMWLLILMVSATFTGKIMNRYNAMIQSVIALNMFIPMIMDAGGNAGSQSSTLIIRGLATGDIEISDYVKVVFKEFRVALMVGVILGIVSFIKCMVIDHVQVKIGLLVSFTLMCTIMMSKLIGGTLPILAKKLNLDPAIMAGPLITTIVDALSLMIYFEVAHMALGI